MGMQQPYIVEQTEQGAFGDFLADGWSDEWVKKWADTHALFGLLLQEALPSGYIGSDPMEMDIPDEAMNELMDGFKDVFYWTLNDFNLYMLEFSVATMRGLPTDTEVREGLYEAYVAEAAEPEEDLLSKEEYLEAIESAQIGSLAETYVENFYSQTCYLTRPEVGMVLELDEAVEVGPATVTVVGFSTDQNPELSGVQHPDLLVEYIDDETGAVSLAVFGPHVFNYHTKIVNQ
jgi:hypothetical protein